MEELTPEDRTSAHQELRRLAEAIDELPPKCREVVWMRRVDDLSQKEVAARLSISQKTVEKHVMKGMKLLAAAMHRTTSAETATEVETETRVDTDQKKHGAP
jgi:RNA polymerase sigma factor (sigma-70 family)